MRGVEGGEVGQRVDRPEHRPGSLLRLRLEDPPLLPVVHILRDEHLPGLISGLVWYQWSLGLLYIVLLFWTLSRTIPGLNLLIYLK